jgi:hypothetical protein
MGNAQLALQPPRRIRLSGRRDPHADFRVGNLVLQVLLVPPRGKHRHPCSLQGPMESDNKLGKVGQEDRDLLAYVQAQGAEGMGKAIRLPTGVTRVPKTEGMMVGGAPRRGAQQLVKGDMRDGDGGGTPLS